MAKELGTNLTILIGAFNPNTNKAGITVLGFSRLMGQAIDQDIEAGVIKPKQRIADGIDIHLFTPYSTPETSHPDGSSIGPADLSMLSNAIQGAFGYKLGILGGEYADQTQIPPNELNLYDGVMPNQPTVDETTQGQEFQDTLTIMGCTPNISVTGLYYFHLIDDNQARQWADTGFFYADKKIINADPQPKSDLPAVEQTIQAAENGSLICPSK